MTAFSNLASAGEIVSWGVMSTPALVIDDDVVLSGRVPPADQIKQLLAAALARGDADPSSR